MLENLSVGLRVLTAPVWLAWRGYQGLWWAFDDAPVVVKKAGAGVPPAPGAVAHGSAVPDAKGAAAAVTQVVRPRPIKELKLGFVSSTILWFPAAYLASWMHNMGWVSQTGALFGTLWTMALLWVISLVAVRRHVLNTPVKRTPMEAARSAVQAMKDAPKAAAAKAAVTVTTLAALPLVARVRGAMASALPPRFRRAARPANVGGPEDRSTWPGCPTRLG